MLSNPLKCLAGVDPVVMPTKAVDPHNTGVALNFTTA